MSAEENTAIIRRWFEEGFNKGNPDILDESIATNYVHHNAFPPPEEIRGLADIKQLVGGYLTAFPDAKITIDDQIAEGDQVVTRFTFRGTHKGEMVGIAPTGKQVTLTVICIDRFAEGKIVEEWENFDTHGMLQQLGAVPPLGKGEE